MILTFRGKKITQRHIDKINKIIASNPGEGRVYLSKQVCIAWDWKQDNARLKDMVCRTLLLKLDRMGLIHLPPQKCTPPNNVALKRKAAPTPVTYRSGTIVIEKDMPLRVMQCRKDAWEKTYDGLVERYHPLGFRHSPGRHLKYIVFDQDERPLACASFCSSPRWIHARNQHLGLTKEDIMKSLPGIVSNDRFLILPWVQTNGNEVIIMEVLEKRLKRDWKLYYRHELAVLEARLESDLDAGIYLAAGWERIGDTIGLNKNTREITVPLKGIYLKVIQDVRQAA